MRVLMSADVVGGVWTYALDLTRGLGDRGVEVTLAAMGAPVTDAQRREAESAGVARLEARPYALEWMPDPWDDVAAAGQWLLALAEDVRPDVVHLNSYSHAALDLGAPVVVVAHSCVLSWWRAVKDGSPPPRWSTYARRVRRGLQHANAVVAPTAAMLHEIERLYGVDGVVIPNGRRRRGLYPQEKDPLVLAAGRLWDEAKNLSALERAARACRWPIHVAGEGGGDATDVVVLGTLSRRDMDRWMRRAAVFCSPARYEPFGLAILEAALCGCALVLGDIESLREVWDDAALFVDPDDAEGFAEAVNALADDPEARARLGEAALRRAAFYGVDDMAAAYLDVYRSHQPVPADAP